jgi:hypothetical protein
MLNDEMVLPIAKLTMPKRESFIKQNFLSVGNKKPQKKSKKPVIMRINGSTMPALGD